MTFKKESVGHGYNESLLRVEHRPLTEPHSKERLLEILDVLKGAGVDAWWYSVSAKGSYPLFPSKVLPYKKDVAIDYYPWLVEEAHKRDIVLFSWEYLNTAPLLMEEHPEWRVKYLEGPEIVEQEKERHNHFVCFNSPYGELLKDYCVEVVNDIGFDGIWFDGCYLFGPADDGFRWTCCCERCAEKFKNETGQNIPTKIDLSNPVFHEYMKWRYCFFMNYWKELADYVRLKNNTALIAYNFFNRAYMGAVSGSPLAENNMDALVAAEGTVKTVQMQIKTLRAVSSNYPPEVWTCLHDGVKLSYPSRPNPDPESLIFYARTCATAGGYASFGLPEPGGCAETLKTMSAALKPLKDNIGGEPVKMCGLVFSGATKDFAYLPDEDATQFYSKNKPVVDNVYGTGFILNALHYPFEIVLDNQFGKIDDYQIIVLPDVQCMSEESSEKLKKYVENGGILVATGECGTKTLDGNIREKGVLDNLFGINRRYDNCDYCIIEPDVDYLQNDGLPKKYMISGKGRLLEVEADVRILAHGRVIRHRKIVGNHDKLVEDDTAKRGENVLTVSDYGVAICECKLGKGRAIYIAPAIGSDYSQNPNRRSREVFKRVLGEITLPYSVEAAANVVVTGWRKNGKMIFHILNQPVTMLTMQGASTALSPEDIVSTGPVEITVQGNFSDVSSPYPNADFSYKIGKTSCKINLQTLHQHMIVILSPFIS